MIEGLAIGRIVHYVSPDLMRVAEHRHQAAIIVAIWDKDTGYCNLDVFPDGSNDGVQSGQMLWATSILYSEAKEPNTWHWPEKE